MPDSSGSHDGGHGWGRRRWRGGPSWIVLLILMIAMSNSSGWGSSASFGFIFAFIAAILVYSAVRSARSRREAEQTFPFPDAEKAKRKRDEMDDSFDLDEAANGHLTERRMRIGVGDDGEMIELPPEDETDPPVKHKRDVRSEDGDTYSI